MNYIKCIKYFTEKVAQSLFAILGKLIPVKNNRILFYSVTGNQYSCSPKYISEYLEKNHKGKFEIVWAFRNMSMDLLLPDGTKCIRYQSMAFFFYYMSSKFIISNIYPYHLIGTKKNQIMIDTWHGGGAYKIAGRDFSEGNTKIEEKTNYYNQSNVTVFVSSSKLFTKYFIHGGMQFEGPIINAGLPRNDIFFMDKQDKDGLIEKVYNYFGIEKNSKILLYAPTWRTEEDCIDFSLDIRALKDALCKRFGGEWEILVRMHMYTTTTIQGDIVNANNYPDMQELLLASDVLVSDYSSSIWDYSLTGKPCFLYTYDLNKYVDSRGFYVDIKKWGFPLCISFEQLVNAILNFNREQFETNMKMHYQMLGGYDDGHACERVVNYLLDSLGE